MGRSSGSIGSTGTKMSGWPGPRSIPTPTVTIRCTSIISRIRTHDMIEAPARPHLGIRLRKIVMHDGRQGFTLIELLVVITIIVVLLALLTPALDKAIYMAELAVCGTNEKAIASGAQMYAVANKRRYPYRPLAEGNPGGKPNNIFVGSVFA